MKRKLLKNILCFTICGSVIAVLFSEPIMNVFAVSEETQEAIDQAEDEKEQRNLAQSIADIVKPYMELM